MSETLGKHTPGPWTLIEVTSNEWQVGARPQTPEYDYADAIAIARVESWDNEPPREDVEHNARLMAAAPDLLEACEAWVRYFEELERISDPNDPLAEARRVYHGKRLDVTRAAIAKATPAPAVNETP